MEYHIVIWDISSKYTLKNIIIDIVFIGKYVVWVAVVSVSLVGLRIIGNKEFEYMA